MKTLGIDSCERSSVRLLVSPKIAAEILGFSERTLWSLTKPRGPIPAVRVANLRSVRYSIEALRNWVATHQS